MHNLNKATREIVSIWTSAGRVTALLIFLTVFPGVIQASPSRVIAIGDVHGNIGRLTTILKDSRLIDQKHDWSGGRSTLVVTGDFLDRGLYIREVMDLLMQLQKQARKDKGEVIVLLGNHEMMNITGDLRYVPDEVYSRFADKKSAERRRKAFEKYYKIRQLQAKRSGRPMPEDLAAFEAEWMIAHPEGFVEYREALSSKGIYGRWLRNLPVVKKIGDTIFIHGGIHPDIANLDLEVINDRVKKEIEAFDSRTRFLAEQGVIESFFTIDELMTACKLELRRLNDKDNSVSFNRLHELEGLKKRVLSSILSMGSWLSVHPDGPLWFRGYAQWNEEEGTRKIEKLLARYSAHHFVIGHTITSDDRITQRFGGRVTMIDTIAPTALEIENGLFTAIYYLGKREKLISSPVATLAAAEASSQ